MILPWALWWSWGGGTVSHVPGIPVLSCGKEIVLNPPNLGRSLRAGFKDWGLGFIMRIWGQHQEEAVQNQQHLDLGLGVVSKDLGCGFKSSGFEVWG